MDELVNRARAQSPAANVALPAVVAPPSLRSSGPSVENEDPLDRFTHAKIVLFGGFSPTGVAEAAFDWALHLAASLRQATLALSALSKQAALLQMSASLSSEGSGGSAPKRAAADDRRFAAEEWGYWPFSLYAEGFLATQRWWDEATSQIHGATRHHLALLNALGEPFRTDDCSRPAQAPSETSYDLASRRGLARPRWVALTQKRERTQRTHKPPSPPARRKSTAVWSTFGGPLTPRARSSMCWSSRSATSTPR